MNILNFLTNGKLAKLELLANQLGAVLWTCAPDYKQLLFVSHNYQKVWQRDIYALYEDITIWKNYLIPENQDQTYQDIKDRNSIINPKHTTMYGINLPDRSTQWILDRTFNITDINNKIIMIAGVAMPIEKSDMEDKRSAITSDKLDKYILEYYDGLVGENLNVDMTSDFYKKIASLSKREKEILELLLYGYTGKQIAKKIAISPRTVETHTNVIKDKFNCLSKSEIISKAIEMRCIHVFLPT